MAFPLAPCHCPARRVECTASGPGCHDVDANRSGPTSVANDAFRRYVVPELGVLAADVLGVPPGP